ncbi:hypothetical protein ACO22_04499 [Paracoccidioides brasiliensis]|nr:hypothetical protein ACO22_04499 [Paracoccidioides brasiliensis]ODH45509.1 hypothetical protein GX48_08410 [Paracoccidioides brasiliensis]
MARHQNQGKRPQGVRKRPQEPVRRSPRLSCLHEQIQSKDRKTEQNHHKHSREEAFSHDHTAVRIYAHYAVLEGEKTNIYRHPIHKFDFTALDGKEKWTAYKFTRNVYDIWMPTHFKRICSAIDQIPPDVDFDVSQSELQYSQQSNSESVFAVEDDDSQPSQRHIASAGVTPTTSFTEETQIFKRPRKKQ